MEKKELMKVALTRVGARCSERTMYNLNGAFNYLHAGWWLRANGFRPRAVLRSRDEVFRHVADDVGGREVLYLEFGVHRGRSIKRWAELLRNPSSKLHGFDSFQGLPHDWRLEGHGRGTFSTAGEPPTVDDPRVQFFVGWFQDTLPRYQWPRHDVLVVMMDADLYSSTATVLAHVKDRLVPGCYLYFDQFHHRCDEVRAFAELLSETSLRFELAATTRDMSSLAFRRIS